MTTAITTVGPLQEALVLATDAGDIQRLRDVAAMAAALQKGARARAIGVGAENQAAAIVLQAERAIGQILLTLPRDKGGVPAQLSRQAGQNTPYQQALLDAGLGRQKTGSGGYISPTHAAEKYQVLARLSDEEFEALLEAKRAENERLAKVDFYRAASPAPTESEKVAVLAKVAEREEADTSAFAAFDKAAGDLIDGISQLPADELARVAAIIKDLVAAYNAEKEARS